MENVPIREHVEKLFETHKQHMDEKFKDLKSEVRSTRGHGHPGLVPWAGLVPLILTVVGLIFLFS